MSTVAVEPTISAPGARPAGVSSPDDAAHSIQAMFDTIAPTYDRANHLLSFGLDRFWWSRAARTLRPILARPEAQVLDLCCGTGDLTLALDRYRPKVPQGLKPLPSATGIGTAEAVPLSKTAPSTDRSTHWDPVIPNEGDRPASATVEGPAVAVKQPAPILAADFSHNMLALAQPKFAGRNIVTLEADALHLPLADSSIDLVTFAFGFRNLADYAAGLAELYRVLRPGGEIAILECNQPGGLIGWCYSLYFRRVLPTLGGLISGTPRAYAYLPDSVQRFPRPPAMKQLITAAGFANPTWTSYTLGTAGLYRAAKP